MTRFSQHQKIKLLGTILGGIGDFLFPRTCAGCGAEDTWLCPACTGLIRILPEQRCPICERRITPGGRPCIECGCAGPLDGMSVAASYDSPLVKRLIHLLKYRFIEETAPHLAALIAKQYEQSSLPIPDVIVPIPLHSRRERWRGYNQSRLLASEFAQKLLPEMKLSVEDILVRTRYTTPQVENRSAEKRKANVSGAFSLQRSVDATRLVRDKCIVLIDDVATTGATINECALTLKNNGAREVYAAVVARQQFD